MRFLYLVALLISTSACVKIKGKDSDPVVNNLGDQAPAVESVQMMPEPNHYLVHLYMPSGSALIQRKLVGEVDSTSEILNLEIQNGHIVDREVMAGKTYRYSFLHVENQTLVLDKTVELKIPMDLVISSSLSLYSDQVWTDYNRIFLLNHSVITTNGFQLYIDTNEFRVENASIQSFHAGAQAPADRAGRSGGVLTIHARQAAGRLKIEMSGEMGATGTAGQSYTQGSKSVGEPGYKGWPGGNSGTGEVLISQANNLCLEVNLKGGVGGPGGPGSLINYPYSEERLPSGAEGDPGDTEDFKFQNPGSCFSTR